MAQLRRRIGTVGAVGVGLSAMLGAGVFYVWAPAASAAGSLLLVSLLIAALIATANAISTTRLAVAHPTAGGAYRYGRAELGETAGFAAGILFLVGKTASAALIAQIAAHYLAPTFATPVAVAVIVVLAAVNATGIRSTATIGLVIAAITIVVIVVVLLVALPAEHPAAAFVAPGSPWGVLAAANAIFFAFAGYARIATLSEEVLAPERTLPRAVIIAVAVTLALYTTVAVSLLVVVGADRIAESSSPLAELAGGGLEFVLRAAAVIASLGSLLGVLAGLSRTSFAMARDGELPGPLARIAERTGSPAIAELVVAAVAILATWLAPSWLLVGLSSCAVLGYYAIAHASSLRRGGALRWRVVAIAGLIGCVIVALSAPWQGTLAVLVIVGATCLGRALFRRRSPA